MTTLILETYTNMPLDEFTCKANINTYVHLIYMNTCTNKKRMTRTNLSVIYHSIEKNIQLAVGGFVGIER